MCEKKSLWIKNQIILKISITFPHCHETVIFLTGLNVNFTFSEGILFEVFVIFDQSLSKLLFNNIQYFY